ncbi:hypothetical protein Syun_019326 [Stephania yunnanensis]|uniref:Uncharacterized protein n=1 Tax=Stephania yunnanensis TaxID=152371 RepID=A0AAP0ITZ7_9MAGN
MSNAQFTFLKARSVLSIFSYLSTTALQAIFIYDLLLFLLGQHVSRVSDGRNRKQGRQPEEVSKGFADGWSKMD